jgi:hypothetical protein
MSEPQVKPSMADDLFEDADMPVTLKDRIVGLVLALAFGTFGVCTWIWPRIAALSEAHPGGRGGRRAKLWLDLLWSRPVGSIAIVLAVVILWGVITKRSASSPSGQ